MAGLEKILYVEDEPRIQFVTKMSLERIGGFTVETCGTGSEAIEAAPGFRPDLVLLDVRLPGLSGPETYVEFRKIPGCEDTPVVFMTANVMKEDIEQYRAMGVVDVIAKPFEPLALIERLREIWAQAHE
jgi:two-component system, OmpR family, response regulator